ncbi:MAG: glutathione S-transferase N-terminal domain-containing protein [SAR324 cluster bacterium]|nr:glutathione S-transferase N-terminal domain-containing protein [SAR324 cluster bacterium]
MIDLYFWPTPNGWKITIMLEELGLPYQLIPVNIGQGDQFKSEFLKISPNNRMPAIVDHDATGGPISVFESGAILMYLAEKTGKFMPSDLKNRYEVIQWVFWQVGNLGPMAGQLSHFVNYAPENNPYSLERYRNEYNRLFGVMERQLENQEFLVGSYSIADMASFPWIVPYKRFEQGFDDFPRLRLWFDTMKRRPAVKKGVDTGKELRELDKNRDDKSHELLFRQTARSVTEAVKKS